MIDTDKYKGHTVGPWESWSDYIIQKGNDWQTPIAEMDFNFKDADAKLIADAPKLLAEVKRLRSIADDLYAYIVSDAGISLKIIEEQMDWRDEE
tara:strand:+ start:90 stop:371 length:282 start_codon:yes stop_codon:yes gene_type:complete